MSGRLEQEDDNFLPQPAEAVSANDNVTGAPEHAINNTSSGVLTTFDHRVAQFG